MYISAFSGSGYTLIFNILPPLQHLVVNDFVLKEIMRHSSPEFIITSSELCTNVKISSSLPHPTQNSSADKSVTDEREKNCIKD